MRQLLLLAVLSLAAHGQMLKSINNDVHPAGGGATFSNAPGTPTTYDSLTSDPNSCNNAGSGTSQVCAITVSPTIAGHTGVIVGNMFGGNNPATSITSVTGGGTWTTGCFDAFNYTGTNYVNSFCAYIPSIGGSATTITITLACLSGCSGTSWAIHYYSLGWSGSSVSIDNIPAVVHNTSGTTTGVDFILSGTNDALFQGMTPGTSGAVTAITGGAGYTTNQKFTPGYEDGAAEQLNSTTSGHPTWTVGSAGTTQAYGLALKGN